MILARILVVCDKSLRIEACRNALEKIRNELGKRPEPENVEVFLLMARFGGSPLRRLSPHTHGLSIVRRLPSLPPSAGEGEDGGSPV